MASLVGISVAQGTPQSSDPATRSTSHTTASSPSTSAKTALTTSENLASTTPSSPTASEISPRTPSITTSHRRPDTPNRSASGGNNNKVQKPTRAKKTLKCVACGRKFGTEAALHTHYSMKHEEGLSQATELLGVTGPTHTHGKEKAEGDATMVMAVAADAAGERRTMGEPLGVGAEESKDDKTTPCQSQWRCTFCARTFETQDILRGHLLADRHRAVIQFAVDKAAEKAHAAAGETEGASADGESTRATNTWIDTHLASPAAERMTTGATLVSAHREHLKALRSASKPPKPLRPHHPPRIEKPPRRRAALPLTGLQPVIPCGSCFRQFASQQAVDMHIRHVHRGIYGAFRLGKATGGRGAETGAVEEGGLSGGEQVEGVAMAGGGGIEGSDISFEDAAAAFGALTLGRKKVRAKNPAAQQVKGRKEERKAKKARDAALDVVAH